MKELIFKIIVIIIVVTVVAPKFLNQIDNAAKELGKSSIKRTNERVNKK